MQGEWEVQRRRLLGLIEQAKAENEKLQPEFGGYPPIYNSKFALDSIRDLLNNASDAFSFRERLLEYPSLNVGLLAAKSLDFIPMFSIYATCLHQIWYFIFPLHFASFGAQQALAYYFYKQQRDYDDVRISSHFYGIDFYKPIVIRLLFKPREIYQWKIGEDAQGDYYAESKRAKPDCLGISSQKKDIQGNIQMREKYIYEVDSQVAVLTSYAAPVLDWWSLEQPNFIQTSGGCVQYFNHNDKCFFKE